jgi:hypothetical protein
VYRLRYRGKNEAERSELYMREEYDTSPAGGRLVSALYIHATVVVTLK